MAKQAWAVIVHNHDEPLQCIAIYLDLVGAQTYAVKEVDDGNARAAWIQECFLTDEARELRREDIAVTKLKDGSMVYTIKNPKLTDGR